MGRGAVVKEVRQQMQYIIIAYKLSLIMLYLSSSRDLFTKNNLYYPIVKRFFQNDIPIKTNVNITKPLTHE